MMNWVFYVKVWYLSIGDKIETDELFTIANNYAEVAEQMENYFKEDLVSFQAYGLDGAFVFVDDIADYLDEARRTFKGD